MNSMLSTALLIKNILCIFMFKNNACFLMERKLIFITFEKVFYFYELYSNIIWKLSTTPIREKILNKLKWNKYSEAERKTYITKKEKSLNKLSENVASFHTWSECDIMR